MISDLGGNYFVSRRAQVLNATDFFYFKPTWTEIDLLKLPLSGQNFCLILFGFNFQISTTRHAMLTDVFVCFSSTSKFRISKGNRQCIKVSYSDNSRFNLIQVVRSEVLKTANMM